MKVSSLGEFNLIEKIKKVIENGKKHRNYNKRRLILGVGDDAAVVAKDSRKAFLATTDMLIEGVHFSKKTASLRQIGWKALACNLSDIAAMGGIPLYALVSIGFPQDTAVKEIEELYRGIESLAGKYRVKIIGGDTVSSPCFFVISITVLGEIEKKELVTRSGAKLGDKILLTGTIGDAGAGLRLLKNPKHLKFFNRYEKYLINRFLLPEPRIKEARIIARTKCATAMIDCSDGLDLSIKFISRQSKVGAKIYTDSIPLSGGLKKTSSAFKKNPLEFALFGGEDYELVFTASPEKTKKIKKQISGVTVIGEIVSKKEGIKFLDKKGKVLKLKAKGYEHFTDNPEF
ncbi:thiamine-phosphate kinase [bacterium]|nr:thiamine-phosphate kinase [bacterium]